MTTPGNGPERSDDSGSSELPDLPPEWGRIIIPDDPAALAAEAEAVRRELRRGPGRRTAGWSAPAGVEPPDGRWLRRGVMPRLSLFVISIAVLATLASFLAAMWPGQSRGLSRDVGGRRAVPADPTGQSLPALDLVDEAGSPVALRGLLPAVIILVDGCDCTPAVRAAAAAAPPGVTVVALSSGEAVPSPLPTGPPVATALVRSLADPAAGLRGFLRIAARPGEGAVLMVNRSGEIVRFLPTAGPALDHSADLARLAHA